MSSKRLMDMIGVSVLIIFAVFCIAIAVEIKTIGDNNLTTGISNLKIISKPFTFAAAGDFSSTSNTDLVLKKIATSNTHFTLALGDLGYGGNGTEQAWCDFVHQRLSKHYYFEILAGNHDDSTKDGDILEYRKCLPNKIDSVNGDYAREYYFDYSRLARFILVSPDVDKYGFDYTKGSPHYDWLASIIDDARKSDVKWIVLGMHKNCISIGTKSCEIGEDILNLAVEKKVDLILQGHEHGYSRSKQLGLSSNCPAITKNKVDAGCIVGQGKNLKKSDGSIIVTVGSGGIALRDINLNDSELGYFETWNGKNTGNSHGFSKFTISNKNLSGEFVGVNGDFTDSFIIESKKD